MTVDAWLEEFFQVIDDNRLRRGQELYRKDKLIEFHKDEMKNKFYAKVKGSRREPYTVEGYFSNVTEEGLPDLADLFIKCSCPDWVEFCKHAVCAVIHYADEFEQSRPTFDFVQEAAASKGNEPEKKMKRLLSSDMATIDSLGSPPFLEVERDLRGIHSIVRQKLRKSK